MAIRGAIAHLDLTVSDLEASLAFYDPVLRHLGFERTATDPTPCWEMRYAAGGSWEVALQPARAEARGVRHDRTAPGLHHVAFHAEGRADVDAVHALLRELGAEVLDPPAEYSGPGYSEGYYAVFFADPDGLKLEVVHEPRVNP